MTLKTEKKKFCVLLSQARYILEKILLYYEGTQKSSYLYINRQIILTIKWKQSILPLSKITYDKIDIFLNSTI